MDDGTYHATLSGLIQTSLSPVFLLAAIGTTLTLIDTRQNRIVDRARALEAQILAHPEQAAKSDAEVRFYLKRVRQIGQAAAMCILSALCVASVVVTLFVDAQTPVHLTLLVEAEFTLGVLLYVGALVFYLRDVFLVNRGLNYTHERVAAVVAAAEKVER